MKVKVSIDTGRAKRSYEGDYAFVSVMNENGLGSRWEQEPSGWKDGLGLFFSAMAALKTVAEQQGDETYKVAARAAMDAMREFDPYNS